MGEEFLVSVAYTYFTDKMQQKTKLYVFGEKGCVCSGLRNHGMALKEYKVSACFDWYFLNAQEFFELLDSWNITKGYRSIEKLNSYEACVLSYMKYGDCIYSLRIKDAYLSVDGKRYIFLGYRDCGTCFMDYDTFIYANENQETRCSLHCNLDIVANIGNYLEDEEIIDFTYRIQDGDVYFKKQT